jgi:hypothetical protein
MFNPSKRNFLVLFILLLLIETGISIFIADSFIRPLLGDLLVAMLVYCFVRLLVNWPALRVALVVWVFTILVEFSQALNLIGLLNLEDNVITRTVLGTSFDWRDLVAYTAGLIIMYAADPLLMRKVPENRHG